MNRSDLEILCIEDNPGDARLIREMITAESSVKHEIHVAESLRAGLDYVRKKKPDIILLDMSLPDSHGLETLDQVSKVASKTAIIVLTGLDDDEVGLRAVQQGAQDYLVKGNFDAVLLNRVIRHSIERQKLLSKLEEALAEIKTLSGLIPICANCKKIRDDSGYWQQLEKYIGDRSEARFSHGFCPQCIKELYPDYAPDE